MTSRNRTGDKILELESIRGIAALLVVVNHIPQWATFPLGLQFIRNGYLMVDLFFVLSGFVIYRNYATKLQNPADLLRFQFLRFGRLYPVHLLFLALFLLLEVLKYFINGHSSFKTTAIQPFSVNTAPALIQQLFLAQAVGPTGNALTFNAPAWSISVEFYTYLFFGIIVLLIGRYKVPVMGLLAVTAIYAVTGSTEGNGYSELLRCLSGFFVGCSVGELTAQMGRTISEFWSILAFLALSTFVCLKKGPIFGPSIYILSACLIWSIVCGRIGTLRRALKSGPFIWLGSISYSLYMSHWLVIYSIDEFLRRVFHFPSDINHVLMIPEAEAAVFSFVAIGACLLCAFTVYKYVENPFRLRSRHFAFSKMP